MTWDLESLPANYETQQILSDNITVITVLHKDTDGQLRPLTNPEAWSVLQLLGVLSDDTNRMGKLSKLRAFARTVIRMPYLFWLELSNELRGLWAGND